MKRKAPCPLWRILLTATVVANLSLILLTAPVSAAGPSSALGAPAPLQIMPAEAALDNTGRVIVRFAGDSLHSTSMALLEERSLQVIGTIEPLSVTVIEVPAGQEFDVAAELSELPCIAWAEPDGPVYAAMQPNDPHFADNQWNMDLINTPVAWDISQGTDEVVIAIIDTGIDLGHPDLADKIVAGIDLVNHDDVAQDDHAHGTHVAGIAAAIGNNGQGVAGVDWNSRLMPIKILNAAGGGYMSDLAQGIIWATDHGADVINMSVASLSNSQTVREAIEYAHIHGVALVAASGNAYQMGYLTIYPAAFDHVIAVGAIGANSEHSSYSSAGSFVDVAAPGGHSNVGPTIYSTFWQNGEHTYNFAEGTSMAAPHVTGLAALLKAVNPDLTPDEIETAIESTAADLGEPGWDELFGSGRIDVAAALESVQPLQPEPAMVPIYVEAEMGRLLTPMNVSTDDRVPSGEYVVSPVAEAGLVEMRFSLDQPQTVYVWGLTRADHAGANSFYVSVDDGPALRWDFEVSDEWIWSSVTNADTGAHQPFTLDAGYHAIRFQTREAGSCLDAIAVGSDASATMQSLSGHYLQTIM